MASLKGVKIYYQKTRYVDSKIQQGVAEILEYLREDGDVMPWEEKPQKTNKTDNIKTNKKQQYKTNKNNTKQQDVLDKSC